MKDRRPRKLKKALKRKFDAHQSFKVAQSALVSALSCAQIAVIASAPVSNIMTPGEPVALKSLRCAQVVMETAQQIKNIMNTGPKNWREA